MTNLVIGTEWRDGEYVGKELRFTGRSLRLSYKPLGFLFFWSGWRQSWMRALRLGKVELEWELDPYSHHVSVIWFRTPGPNRVRSWYLPAITPWRRRALAKQAREWEQSKREAQERRATMEAQLEQRHHNLIRESVGKFVEYLNANDDGYNERPYTVGWFLDTAENKYADTSPVFLREDDDERDLLYMELSVYDGDDGGPSMLYIHAERNWVYDSNAGTRVDEESYRLCSVVHEFDTMWTAIYQRAT